MKNLCVSLLISAITILLCGCASTQPSMSSPDQPELISMTSLPPVSSMYPASGVKLKMLFHVKRDGSIMEVKMMNSSGDPSWDKGAVDSMSKWQFSAFPASDTSPDIWVRNTVILQVQEPIILTLGELVTTNQQVADSLYAMLKGGADFDALTKQVPAGAKEPLGRFLGATDIARYPKSVRDALSNLGINEFTAPLRIGTEFVIYKRYLPDGMEDPAQQK
jgi:TonB family protein